MFEAGRYGIKNKSGFYLYDEKTSKKKGRDSSAYQFFKGNGKQTLPVETIQDRAVMLMLKEAVLCLEDGIIDNPRVGDTGAVFGIGFLPFTGGPFLYMDTIGIDNVVKTMEDLKAKYGQKFEVPKLLKEMQSANKTFHSTN